MNKKFENYLTQSFNDEKIFEQPKKKKRGGVFKKATAIFTASLLTVTTFFGITGCKKKDKNEPSKPADSIVRDLEDPALGFVSLNDLGTEQKWEKNPASIYSNATNGIDINSIAVGSNGKLYVSQDDANRAKNVGTTVDTKNGTLVVKEENGKTVAYDTTPATEYVERDPKTGKEETKPLGSDGVPEGYKPASDGTLEEVGYITAPYSLYDTQGVEVVVKGQSMKESEWNEALKKYSKTKPTKKEEPTTKVEIVEEVTLSDEEIQRQIDEEMRKRGYTNGSYGYNSETTTMPEPVEEETRIFYETTEQPSEKVVDYTEEFTPAEGYEDYDDSQLWGYVDGELVIINPDDVYVEEEGYQYTKSR